jgi:hypothetical protein
MMLYAACMSLPARLMSGFVVLGVLAGGPAAAEDDNAAHIPLETRKLIKAKFEDNFLFPELVEWRFDFTRPYPTSGTAVCGRVNYQDSTHGYIGFKPFFALIVDGRVTDYHIVPGVYAQDVTYAGLAAYKIACGEPPK